MVGIYIRVSTPEQAKEGYSVGEQTERLKAYCTAMGWEIYQTYVDPGYSGSNMERPALKMLINDVENGKIQKVVVYKLDRLSRSQMDTLYLIEKVFIPHGVDFVSMNENLDTGSSFGRAVIGIMSAFAQLEREMISERMTMGKDARRKEGKWMGSVSPYGYDYSKEDGLTVNEDEAAQVREMFDLFNSGTKLYDIQTKFLEKGYTIRGREWRLFSIRYMLDNKVYAGYIRNGDEWLKGIHEPIITEETYEQAYERMEANRERFAEYGVSMNGDKHSTLLGGMIYCKRCGARYAKRLSGDPASRHYTYCCYSRMKVARHMVKDPNCRNKIYRVEELDDIVLNEIRKLKLSPELLNAKQPIKKDVSAQIDKIDKQISRFLDLYGTGRFSFEQLDAKVKPLEEQKSKLLATEPRKTPQKEAINAIDSLDDVLATDDLKTARKLIESLINRIDIDGDDIFINWRF